MMKKEYVYVIILAVFVICVESFTYIKKNFFPENEEKETIQKEPDYAIENFDMQIVVLESGDLKVTENILYDLKNNSNQVFRNYTLEEYSHGNSNSYQPEKLGITRILCNGEEMGEDIITSTGIIINPKKETGLKKYVVEYTLENSVEMCNNVSEFLCNLNLGTLEKEARDFDLTVKAENSGEILDAEFLGDEDFDFKIENGVLNVHKDRILPENKIWINVKMENECVPKTNRIMLEDRAISFSEMKQSVDP